MITRTVLLALKSEDISDRHMTRIRALLPDARLVVTAQHDELEPLIAEAEIIAGHVPAPWLTRATKLRWYQQWGAGTDWLMSNPEVAHLDFILTNASGVHAIPISEHILAFILAFARRLPEAIRAQEQHRWERSFDSEDHRAFELAGKTMLLVGVGAIGRRTGQIAAALGMRVLGMRHDPSKSVPGIEHMYGPQELEQALPEADFVVLTLPLTEESRSMINAQCLAKMKRSAYLINIGRGGTVDEPALIEALRSGQIAGAGLDVFATEPLPPDSPLWDLPNVIVTAHYSGDTPFYDERALDIFVDNLERYLKGQPMKNVVDKQRGY